MSDPPRPQLPRRTIFPRDHVRTEPLSPAEFEEAKRREAERKTWDPGYVTREEAEEIPSEALDARPELRDRVRRSQPDWPENRLSASRALGSLPTGEGQEVASRGADAADFMETSGRCLFDGDSGER